MAIPLLALEPVQLNLMRASAPAKEYAASAAADLLRVSLVKRTQHTQACQLRAVVWRLQHVRSTIVDLESQLDEMADRVIDLEDEVEELVVVNQRLRYDLNDRTLPRRLSAPAVSRASVIADMDADAAARSWAYVSENQA